MQSSVLTLSCLFMGCFAGFYGRSRGQGCNEFDPPALNYVNLNELEGIWYEIRVKPGTSVAQTTRTVNTVVEWIKDQDKAITSARLVQNPVICIYAVLDFIRIPGSKSEFEFTTSSGFRVFQWRLLFKSSKYLVSWGCIARQGKRCVDWLSVVLSRSPSRIIPENDLRWLDKISNRATCKTISGDYATTVQAEEDCRRLGLPAEQVCPSYQYTPRIFKTPFF